MMNNLMPNPFSKLDYAEPSPGLETRILLRIEKIRAEDARRNLFVWGMTAVLSVVALVPAVRYAASELSGSGILSYLSLLSSDGAAIMASWKEFSILVAESIPFYGIIAVLSALFVVSVSVFKVMSGIRYLPFNYKLTI